jgi:hypothetical protein
MSGLNWQWPLEDDETLAWQGRPAPRCYTFRNWKLSAAATLLFFGSSFWTMLAYELIVTDGNPWWLLLIPAPFVLLSLWFGPIGLLLARVRWEKEFYALTDSRLMVRSGLFSARIKTFLLKDILDWKQKKYSEYLISVRMQINNHQPVILHCLEQPQNLLGQLQRVSENPATKGDSV